PFDLTTLTPVTQLAAGPFIWAASKSFPLKNLGGVVAYAKKNPHRLFFAAGGRPGSAPYLAAELFKAKTGIAVALGPYGGGSPTIDTLLGGQTDVVLDSLAAIAPLAKAGRLQLLAVTSAKRFPALPDLPTVMEGGVPDYEIDRWFGIVAPANTPPDIAKRLRDAAAKALAAPDVVDQLD